MIGYYIVGYVLFAFTAFVTLWPLLKVASDLDDQREEMLREKKAEDAKKIK